MGPLGYVSFIAVGAAFGVLYFLLLYRTVQLHAAGVEIMRIAPLYVLRAAGAVTLFWFLAREGALPLLLALAGFLVARSATHYFLGFDGRWKRIL